MVPSIPLSTVGALIAALSAAPRPGDHEENPAAARPPASLAFGDYDGDGWLDALAIGAGGTLRLLHNMGDGRFEDVSGFTGLGTVSDAGLVLWDDYDQDKQLDLFVATACGPRHLFQNLGGTFEDVAGTSGLGGEGCDERLARWMDYDQDGRLDLYLEGAAGVRLYHALADGRFEEQVLSATGAQGSTPVVFVTEAGTGSDSAPGSTARADTSGRGPRSTVVVRGELPGAAPLHGSRLDPPVAGGTQSLVVASVCAASIKDQASPSTCVKASTTPALGELYPLSTSLNVSGAGNVGIGTTTPGAKLEVAGTARVTDTLTLNPSGDQALDVSTGSIYKAGALFIHTKGGGGGNTAIGNQAQPNLGAFGSSNTACGYQALGSSVGGSRNTAVGSRALSSSFSGLDNTAVGSSALRFNTFGGTNTATGSGALANNTTGSSNTAIGSSALNDNTTGYRNTAVGVDALQSNTVGLLNTATGWRALYSNTAGARNVASGYRALAANTTGYRNVASGYRALDHNTTGNFNAACGSEALGQNYTGNFNTASGSRALRANTSGSSNTATGYKALFSNTNGDGNTASGHTALSSNTTGDANTASGFRALRSNTVGNFNTASGYGALYSNSSGGYNTAVGHGALYDNSTGSRNIALGRDSGRHLTTGNDNIAIGNLGVAGEGAAIRVGTAGTQTRAFIAGIRGVTTANANAIPVLVDSAGQLGTISSSRRFKEDIQDMGDATDKLLALRPVTFRYKPEVQAGERPLEYGLIAEEVAEVFPDLVVYDDEGQPFTVKYHLLSAMLLNELEKLHAHERDLEARLEALESRAAAPGMRPEHR